KDKENQSSSNREILGAGAVGSGYGITITALSTSGCAYTSECMVQGIDLTSNPEERKSPGDYGEFTANQLLSEIKDGGCVPSFMQWLVILLLPLTPAMNASFCTIGELTPEAKRAIQMASLFMGISYRVKRRVITQEAEVPIQQEDIGLDTESEESEIEENDNWKIIKEEDKDELENDDNEDMSDEIMSSEDIEENPTEIYEIKIIQNEISVLGRGFHNIARKPS
ncbi:MAG: hypothetical protein EZS28_032567, partial [Streblomastix strix]